MKHSTGRAREVVVWWLALSGLWILTVPALTFSEILAGVGCALPCAGLAPAARGAVAAHWRFRVTWLKWFAVLIPAIFADSVRLPAWAVRQESPEFGVLRLKTESDPAHAAGYRAMAAGVLAMTPSTVVIDERASDHTLVVHELGSRKRLRRMVAR